ncbi:Disease resistance protein (TIR-NBS-LRR class) family [Raphanus sativus]|uniref:ADP-ribosyl cyclase/cyclic ADP-ribose hydrolase n=1 Tax=Raphanus sativus TaxID=3726 RepID=A0A9W3CF06_RAPSA|nr:disease resistance protein RML1B isoform X1 [Raphanus sativus]KAJ4877268.1 Disease resistance protein (TIR-NBS-LRR class) family [Raphanus sativus]
MASASSFASRNYKFNVFSSFHGPDVRKTLLSHMREQFKRNGITMFDDQEIVRSQEIAPSLTNGIRESRISIVILSKKYASSSWCLDELVEILECKRAMGQIVMTIFYRVDPSDVRKQSGEFGISFNETCANKPDEERQKWSKALREVGNIAGEDFQKWDNEVNMIKKITRDVSDKLNATSSRDFDGMVGLESHLRKMEDLLDFDYDGVKMVGISGPAGIGKTTIARALHSRFSHKFQLTCFTENLRGSYHSSGLDDYGLQLHLQEQLLSKVLNQDGTRVCHLGVLPQRSSSLRVLIILDDVNSLKQLEALAGDTSWFGFGSRIIVTTEDQELLQQHGIDNIYHVSFPSRQEGLEILCRYAFKQCSPKEGFEELAIRITELCCKLPLGLRVVGSSLRGKREDEWIDVMSRLENILDQDIEKVLKVGYESLEDNEQTLFLYIAIFFKYNDGDLVKAMLAGIDLDVKYGLKILERKSLIEISARGEIRMHRLLQQVGKRAIRRQKLRNRQILVDANDICDVLLNNTVTSKVVGISFDTSAINEVFISKGAFKRMPNLRFLKVINSKYDVCERMDIPEEIELPQRLRFLHWKAYPIKCLPPTFNTECLVKLDLRHSQLEKLWEGTQPLKNLKQMDLSYSYYLKELPDLSNATNLEALKLNVCKSLVELPSSISNLGKLKDLWLVSCTNLEVVPTNYTFSSLNPIHIEISRTNMTTFGMSVPAANEVPPVSALSLPHYFSLSLSYNPKLKTLTQFPMTITRLDLNCSGMETICCIKDLHMLEAIFLLSCRELKSLPELPASLKSLHAGDCESLETVFCPLNTPLAKLTFTNCLKLGQQARNEIIHQRFHRSLQLGWSWLPGAEVPGEFELRALGNTLSFPLSTFSKFKVCLVCSPGNLPDSYYGHHLICRRIRKGYSYPIQEIGKCLFFISSNQPAKHLLVFHSDLLLEYGCLEESGDLTFEFTCDVKYFDIIECGVQIVKEEPDESNNGGSGDEDGDSNHWNTQESGQDSDEEEEADIISGTRSECGLSDQ